VAKSDAERRRECRRRQRDGLLLLPGVEVPDVDWPETLIALGFLRAIAVATSAFIRNTAAGTAENVTS
jgi:hypothetical protein